MTSTHRPQLTYNRESYPIWIWSGIESHVAIIIASLPALNHFFGYVKAGTVVSGLRYGSKVNDSTGMSSRKGYGRTTSGTDSQIGYDAKSPEVYDRAIHVRHDIKLEEFMNDKQYDIPSKAPNVDDPRWAAGSRFDDEEIALTPKGEKRPATATTWLEDDTSGDDSQAPSRRASASRKYSGFADSRRFY